MTEITFRFVIELSEDTMQFIWQLVDELQHDGEDNDDEDETDDSDRSAGDT